MSVREPAKLGEQKKKIFHRWCPACCRCRRRRVALPLPPPPPLRSHFSHILTPNRTQKSRQNTLQIHTDPKQQASASAFHQTLLLLLFFLKFLTLRCGFISHQADCAGGAESAEERSAEDGFLRHRAPLPQRAPPGESSLSGEGSFWTLMREDCRHFEESNLTVSMRGAAGLQE